MPSLTVTEKLLSTHLRSGTLVPGEELALGIDQTLTQDATGTTVMLELEAMGIDRVQTELSVQYVDHNLIQADHRNADDHAFLRTACARYGRDRDARHRQRRNRGGPGSDRRTLAAADARELGSGAGGNATTVGQRQGRDPRDAAPPRGRWRPRPHHRVLRARAGLSERHGPARHRQHGGRARRHHFGLSCRQRGLAVSFDINPTSRRTLADLARTGHLVQLVEAGARIHQAGCNGCIGMGQAPATEQYSLRTVPRNFPGRSGSREDMVCLVSPETAAASALRGCITDPRSLAETRAYPHPMTPPHHLHLAFHDFVPPPPAHEAQDTALIKGPDIVALPRLEPLPKRLVLEVLLVVGDDLSTDEIMPAGTRVLPWRSNVPRLSEFAFEAVDPDYVSRARERRDRGIAHAIVAGRNYGQGSSREHAALVPRFLGPRVVLAKSFARIHRHNLVDHGVLPLHGSARSSVPAGSFLGQLDVGRWWPEPSTSTTEDQRVQRLLRLPWSGRLLGRPWIHP